jgi:hypothetical protein
MKYVLWALAIYPGIPLAMILISDWAGFKQ